MPGKPTDFQSTRRVCLRLGLAAGALLLSRNLTAAELTRLEESDPQAVQLGYKHDADQVDPKAQPAYRPNRSCANCRFFYAENNGWGECTIFPARLVNSRGWCSAWAANMG